MIYSAAIALAVSFSHFCPAQLTTGGILQQSVYLSPSARCHYRSSYLSVSCCRGRTVCEGPQGKHAINGESAACSQVLCVSVGHMRPKVNRVQGLKLYNQSLF